MTVKEALDYIEKERSFIFNDYAPIKFGYGTINKLLWNIICLLEDKKDIMFEGDMTKWVGK